MSQVATYRDRGPVVAKPYASGGCPISVDNEKCGETQGLDIIMDFHKTYQEKMNEIDISAGGDNLQEKVDLQEQWINDLTEQNKLLARVIQELESETIGKINQLEDKLNNAVRSFGEEDNAPLEEKEKVKEPNEQQKVPSEIEEDLMKQSEENTRLKQFEIQSEKEIANYSMSKKESDNLKLDDEHQVDEEAKDAIEASEDSKDGNEILLPEDASTRTPSKKISFISDQIENGDDSGIDSPNKGMAISKVSSKSVHLIIEDRKNGSQVVEPQKDLSVTSDMPKPPRINSVPVIATQDSLELKRVTSQVSEEKTDENVCMCELEEYWNELDKLREENRMLREGGEIKRLRDEVEDKMKRILELNDENRTLNDMINILRKNEVVNDEKVPSSGLEPSSSDSDFTTEARQPPKPPNKPPSSKKRFPCRENEDNEYKDKNTRNSRKRIHCACQKCTEETKKSLQFIDVYQTQDKGKFISDSSSTVCNEEVCSCMKYFSPFNSQHRVRGGNDVDHPSTVATFPNSQYVEVLEECEDQTCPVKETNTTITYNELSASLCKNKSCMTEGCEVYPENSGFKRTHCNVDSCMNTICAEEIKIEDFGNECCDRTCPNKDHYEPQRRFPGMVDVERPLKEEGPVCNDISPTDCIDSTCQVSECPVKIENFPSDDSSQMIPSEIEKGPIQPADDNTPQFTQEQPSRPNAAEMTDNPSAPQSVQKPPSVCICGHPEECLTNDGQGSKSGVIPTKAPRTPSENEEYCPVCRCIIKRGDKTPEKTNDVAISPMQPGPQDVEEPPQNEEDDVEKEIKPSDDPEESLIPNEDKVHPVDTEVAPEDFNETNEEPPLDELAKPSELPSESDKKEPSPVSPENPTESYPETNPEDHVPEKDQNPPDSEKKIDDDGAKNRSPPTESKSTEPFPTDDDRTIIRCVCRSKYCKLIPDPDNPNQKLCVDVSDADLECKENQCICRPTCPMEEKNEGKSAALTYQVPANVITVNQLYQMPKTPESLSKEQEYAGLSRKDRRTAYISPRKSSSKYEWQENVDELSGDDKMKNADLKLLIADLKSKLLDAEDRIDELKAEKKFKDKDNDSISSKWSKKEREEYEYLKQRVKLLEQGKGDTANINSNLQTAEEKTVIKNQLKKLTKKNKCYEEVVQFFKEEMSVMSDELMTLQEVLNVTNISSQEENNKLIGAILQLRRINDRLVNHLCEIEKQAVLENQINQINEARINELQNIISSKNNDLNQHDDIIQDMRKKLNNATKQNADLKKTIKNLTDTVVEIQEGIRSVERDHMKNVNDISHVESKVCLANGDLEAVKTCIEQKNERIQELENQLKHQGVNFVLATKELGMVKEKNVERKEMIKSLKEQLSVTEKKNQQVIEDYQSILKKLQEYTSLEHMKNYELNHYKSLVEEMKRSLVQLNTGLEKCEASNIHFYDEIPHRMNSLPIGFDEFKKSMADLKKKLSDADFKGGLIEEELLKVKNSHISRIPEGMMDTRNESEVKIMGSVKEQNRLCELVEQQRGEIEKLKRELEMEKAVACSWKRSVSELKNEKTSSNAETEISQLKCELNKSINRQKMLNEENDEIHNQMMNLQKKLNNLEESYNILKQENEEYKVKLKMIVREKEYLLHKNQDLAKTVEQMRSTHDQLEKQCRTMMKKMSEEKSWVATPMLQPFSPRRYTACNSARRAASPVRARKLERNAADLRYRTASPWQNITAYEDEEFIPENVNNHKSHIMRNTSYNSNSSPYNSRSPSPRSHSLHEIEDEFDDLSTCDWISPDYKEADTDDGEDVFIGRIGLMTAQIHEANEKWQNKMKKDHLSKSHTNKK